MTKILAVENIIEVPFERLHAEGVVNLLCDIEQTLVGYRETEIRPEILEHIRTARAAGHIATLSLLTDHNDEKYIQEVASQLDDAPYYFARTWREWKPNPKNLRAALRDSGATPSDTVIVGDRFTSEVLLGVLTRLSYAFWVNPLGEKEGWDNRYIWRPTEKLIRPFVPKAKK